MHVVVFLMLGIFLYVFMEDTQCNVSTLRNCNEAQKAKIVEYENTDVEKLRLLVDMHNTELSAVSFEARRKKNAIVGRMKDVEIQILSIYDELKSIAESYKEESLEIMDRYKKPILHDIILRKELDSEQVEKKVAQNGEDDAHSGEI